MKTCVGKISQRLMALSETMSHLGGQCPDDSCIASVNQGFGRFQWQGQMRLALPCPISKGKESEVVKKKMMKMMATSKCFMSLL